MNKVAKQLDDMDFENEIRKMAAHEKMQFFAFLNFLDFRVKLKNERTQELLDEMLGLTGSLIYEDFVGSNFDKRLEDLLEVFFNNEMD